MFMPGIICATAGTGRSAAAAQAASRVGLVIGSTPRGKHERGAGCARRSCLRAGRRCCRGGSLARIEPRETGNPDFGTSGRRRDIRAAFQGRWRDTADAIMHGDRLVLMRRRRGCGMMHRHHHRHRRIMARRRGHRRKGEGGEEQRQDQPGKHYRGNRPRQRSSQPSLCFRRPIGIVPR